MSPHKVQQLHKRLFLLLQTQEAPRRVEPLHCSHIFKCFLTPGRVTNISKGRAKWLLSQDNGYCGQSH